MLLVLENPKYFMEKNKQIISKFKIVPFYDVALWDVKRFVLSNITSEFPVVKLGKFINEENTKIKLFDFPDETFGILGVSNKTGIFDAYEEKGSNINQPYKKMEIGFLAYNPYRINVGSIGIKEESNKFQYISPAYVVFSCKTELNPDFLFKLFKTDTFNKIINENTTGSVRQNLTFDVLQSLQIPLPHIEIQNNLLSNYYQKITLAEQQEIEAEKLEKEIDKYILSYLGIVLEKKEKKKGLNFSEFELIDRWATDYIFNTNALSGIFKGKYPTQRMNEILLEVQYGLSEKASVEPIGIPMLRMNNIHNATLTIDNLKYLQLPEKQKDKSLLNFGDLLFNRTNSKELVGKTAVFDLEGEYVFASYLIRLKVNTEKINNYYINFLLNSSIGRTQIDMVSRQVLGQANVNTQEIGDFIFPIPPLDIQNEIVTHIQKQKAQIKHLREAALSNRNTAIQTFENAIFNS